MSWGSRSRALCWMTFVMLDTMPMPMSSSAWTGLTLAPIKETATLTDEGETEAKSSRGGEMR